MKMKRKSLKTLSMFVALLVLISTVACGFSTNSKKSAPATSSLSPVELQFLMVGDAPRDLDLVAQKVNELAKKDLNATVKFSYTSWTDFGTKYNLALASGQPLDLIYTASWLDYSKLARKGAFKALDTLLPKYAPDLYKFVPKDYWNQVKVDGKIYTIPSTWKEYTSEGLQFRADLQKKYKLPVPNTIANFEAYMDGVKKNVPGQTLSMEYTNPGSDMAFNAFALVSNFKYKWVNQSSHYGLVAPYATPSKITAYWGSSQFLADMKLLKKWADKGYWSRSALSTKTDPTAFDTGKCVVIMGGQNAPKYGSAVSNAQTAHPDWEIGFVDYPSVSGVAQVAHAAQNGFAIPASSQNPERALMFYQKLVLDKTYNQLTEYGIEGTHYTVKNGKYESVGDPSKSGFPREGMNGWAWRNENFMLYPASYTAVKAIFSKMDKVAKAQPLYKGVNIFDGFNEDYSSYQSERAALNTVMTQYLAPLEAGLVDNVDDGVKTFMEKAKAAGLDKIQSEYIKQWKAYCKAYNYK